MPWKPPCRDYLQGEALRSRLYRDGVPHRVLAEQLRITRPYLSQLLSGRRHLSAELRHRLRGAAALEGFSDDELWERRDLPGSSPLCPQQPDPVVDSCLEAVTFVATENGGRDAD